MQFSTSVLFVGFLNVALAGASPAEILSEEQRLRGVADDIINKTICAVIDSFTDPLFIDNKHFNLTISGISTGYANISNFIVAGFKEVVPTEIDCDLFGWSLNATIKAPQLSISTKYDEDFVLMDLLPVYGNGKVELDLENVELKMRASYKLNPPSIYNVTLNFDLEKAVFDISGLLDNSAVSILLEEVLNDNILYFIKNHHEFVDRVLSSIVNSIWGNGDNTIALPELDEELAAFKKEFESLNL